MSVLWILFVCSLVVLPGIALLAFRWAMRQGEFRHLEKTALSIFDDDEPVGQTTDCFPGGQRGKKPAPTRPPNPISRPRLPEA
jgi:cbb3-type cytochrome oxidase maturation protein